MFCIGFQNFARRAAALTLHAGQGDALDKGALGEEKC
jgi:hypothetical protein